MVFVENTAKKTKHLDWSRVEAWTIFKTAGWSMYYETGDGGYELSEL